MDPSEREAWREADRILGELLDGPDRERGARLAAMGLSPAMSQRVQRMLNALDAGDGMLDHPERVLLPVSVDAMCGRRLGRWELDAEIGRGGMAVVYRARSVEGPAGQVAALKIVTLAALAGSGRERFLHEQDVLLRLRHPWIAPLFDAGIADDGTPWLAMALVDGQRIDAWCAASNADVRKRVGLVLDVCEAVAHAHRNLVIHRDIKPSNVLVDDSGRVRLLDFGIARLHQGDADGEPERTATALRALTPEYAAPEQFDGAPPTTAMDVYGIGALLYRLLSGVAPRDGAGRETRRHDADRDLDAIVGKALEAEPERRYGSVDALVDDLQRWRDGRTVRARPATWHYRLRTFLVRNRLGVGASLALLLAVAAGVGATLLQSRQAREQAELARLNAERAGEQAQRAITVRDFLADVFASTNPSTGTVPDALDLLTEGARRARELRAQDPRAAADILLITGNARVALSDFDPAEADLLLALELFGHDRPLPAPEIAAAHWHLGRLYKQRGPPDKALDHYRTALDWASRGQQGAEDLLVYQVSLASALSLDGAAPEAERLLRAALERLPPGMRDTQQHLDALNALGTALSMQDADQEEQLALHEQRLEVARKLYGEDNGWYAYTLADAVPTLRRFDQYLGRAEEVGRQAVAITDRIYSRPHLMAAVANCNLAYVLLQVEKLDEARTYFDRAVAIDEALERNDPHAESCRSGRARTRLALGDLAGAGEDLREDRRMLLAAGQARSRAWLNHCVLDARIRRARDPAAVLQPFFAACERERAPSVEDLPEGYVAARDALLGAAP